MNVKMTKPIEVSFESWEKLRAKIYSDYPPSVSLIRDKMKKVLGFTTREHYDFGSGNVSCVMLDFFNEKKRTFFIMKYGDYLNDR
jgi:hypothetical protein